MMRFDRRHRLPARWLAAGVLVVPVLGGCAGAGASPTPPPAAVPSPAASMATGVMAAGQFHDVDGTASGTAQIVVKPDGVYEVVFEDFQTESKEHTNVVLVANRDVTATGDVDKSALLDLGALKATAGMQEYVIPADMAKGVMDGYHTVVIWDTEMAHAVAAAPLK